MPNQFETEGLRRVVFGQGSAAKLAAEVELVGGGPVLVVIDPMVREAEVAQAALDGLEKAGVAYFIYSEITREPEPSEADAAAELGRKQKVKAVAGIGGGSALDLAKAAAVLITNPGQCTDYIGLNLVKQPGLPVICLPTTAGTGSECTFTAVFTRREDKLKGGINGRFLYAHTAILDPLLTVSCPAYITAVVGMDALTHAMEAYTSLKAHSLSELNSIRAIELIGKHLRPAVANGDNLAAREGMMLASYLAGLALAQAGVGAVHAMAYPLGAFHDIPHGEANAVLLPYVLEYNLLACPERFAAMARALTSLRNKTPEREAAEICVDEIFELNHDIGVPAGLKELGLDDANITAWAEKAIKVAVPIANKPAQGDGPGYQGHLPAGV